MSFYFSHNSGGSQFRGFLQSCVKIVQSVNFSGNSRGISACCQDLLFRKICRFARLRRRGARSSGQIPIPGNKNLIIAGGLTVALQRRFFKIISCQKRHFASNQLKTLPALRLAHHSGRLTPKRKAAPEDGLHAYEPVRHQNFSTWFLTMVCLLVTV